MSSDESPPPYAPSDRRWLDQDPRRPSELSSVDSGVSAGRCAMLGCLTLFVGGTLMILCAGFGTYYIVGKQIEKYTETQPKEIPTVEYEPERLEELESRIAEFQSVIAEESNAPGSEASPTVIAEAQDPEDQDPEDQDPEDQDPKARDPEVKDLADPEQADQSPVELVLSADDINALIATEEKLRGRLFVRIENGKISGDISIPIDSFVPGSKGRYLNGSGTFDVSLEDGELNVFLEDAVVKGEPLPKELLKAMRTENLAKDVSKDKRTAEMIRRFESIEVDDDKVLVRLKNGIESD